MARYSKFLFIELPICGAFWTGVHLGRVSASAMSKKGHKRREGRPMTKAWEGLITTKRRRLGDPVIIDGLTTSPHLNGLRAEVWAENKKTNFWDPDTRRYGVRITSPGRISTNRLM